MIIVGMCLFQRFFQCFKVSLLFAVLEQDVSVGPLSVRTWRNKVGVMVPSRGKEGVPPLPSAREKKPIPHHNLWRNGETLDTGVYCSLQNGLCGDRELL